MSAAEFAALPEDAEARFELQEGALVMPPRPVPVRQDCLFELGSQLRPQVPAHLKMLLEVDVDLQLVPPGRPGTVRVPDLVVITRASFDRVRNEGGLLRAAEVVLAVEILSTGSRRTDGVVEHGEYADAGPVTGSFASEVPFPVRVDLTALG
ncbi:Uma2 family endonuclease [Pseudonocardia sp. MH-G8]|uniref:Uma2 family endonuclease n=1 Tax=Pseudonocardia sp. MH-G8 TaxID=1854588 RepID=UPI000BA0C147|nr:Uma2 family endonuclease [Pseudonocardia sp. MH-G8]OZM84210.1 hypothetical protein CFP66_00190 [Pseudonocardia sp. MH-G8]